MRCLRLSAAPCCGLPLLLLLACGCGREERARVKKEAAQAEAREAKQRDALRDLEASRRALEAEANRCQTEFAKAQGRIAELEGERLELIQARDRLADRLTAAQKDRANALAEIQKLTEDIHRFVRVAEEARGPRGGVPRPAEPIRATVTAVDKELGLVVFNAGRPKGVRKGDHFVASRKGKRVGTIVVDETFPDVSAAHYLRDQMATDVEVADTVLEQRRDAADEEAERRQRELAALRKRIADLEHERRRLAIALDDARERLRAAEAARRADQEPAADPQFLAAQRVLKLLKAEVEARGPGAFPLPEGGLRPAHKALRGKTLAADNRVGLAVLNVGQREGCELGYEFIVSRRGERIASVVVIEVFPDLCVARFLKARMKGAVQVGDEAKARPADF